MPTFTVQLFAAARDRARRSEVQVTVAAPATVEALLAQVVEAIPALAGLVPHLRVAVDQEFAAPGQVVPEDAEVALIPPVAGGSDAPLARVVDRPLSLAEVVDAVQGHARGGLVTFTGVVRDVSRGKRVSRLHYEAYVPMAEKKLEQLIDEVKAALPGVEVAVVHRVGTLVPGDVAVVIAVAAPHRKEAFRGCELMIDRLKEDVPIWKHESTDDGEVWVGLGP